MPKAGLGSIIDKGFINSFLGVAKSRASNSNNLASALNGGEASSTSISDGLRLGARAFGNAVQNLNALTNFVGLSEGTLGQLGDLTGEMIALAKKATKSSTGFASRKKLVVEFQSLAREFKRITADAKVGERELLKAGDIQDLFYTLGLDKDTSQSVASMFDKFLFEGDDEELASEDAKGVGFIKIPASAFIGPAQEVSVGAYTDVQVSTAAVQSSSITATGGVALSGTTATFTDAGSTTSLNGVRELLSTDSFSNNSVIASSANFAGYNSSGSEQLFLVDASGTVLQQLTNNQDASLRYTSADASHDGRTFAYTASSVAGHTLGVSTVSALGSDPALLTEHFVDSGASAYTAVKVSSDGSHVAYSEEDSSGDSRVVLRDTLEFERNNSLYQQVNSNQEFDFIKSDTLLLGRQSGASNDVVSFSANSTSTIVASGLESLRGLTTIEESATSNGDFYYAFINDADETIELRRKGRGLVAQTSIAGDSVNQVSLASVASGTEAVALGYQGTRPGLSGGNEEHLYSLAENGTQTLSVPTRLAVATQKVGAVLDSANKLLRAPDAYRLLHDLEGLQHQIETNIKALGNARELIGDNIELVRSAGFAFLNLSDQISGEEEANDVAKQLRKAIRSAPAQALTQAENLENIAVAALTNDNDDVGLDS